MPLDALVTGRIATFAGASGYGWVEAIGIRDGRVAFAGSAVDLETRADPHTLRVELAPGEIAIPGLIDAHLHLLDAAMEAEQVDLGGSATLEAGLGAVRAAHLALPEGAWLQGGGWDHRRWGRWPTAADLEAVAPGRPVALWSFDHHAVWTSTTGLAAAGLAALTTIDADPPGGIIRRLPSGAAEGVVLENACPLVLGRVPAPDDATVTRVLGAMGRRLLELGVVGVHDPGNVSPDVSLLAHGAYARLAADGELPIRVHASVRTESLDLAIAARRRSGAPLGPGTAHWAEMGWLKLFADGTLGAGTAALLEPRTGADDLGVFRDDPASLAAHAARAADAGIATQIHAIGDAAARAALDALEPTVARVSVMPRLEHVQLVSATDRARFGPMGIAASVQPVHLRDDAESARRDWGQRAEADGYAWRSLLDAGAVVAFGTDAPVEPIDPWPGIAMAVLRRDPSWPEGTDAYGPHEALDLETALRAATVGPATVARTPDRGRLVPGCHADLAVLPAAPREPEAQAAGFAAVRPRLVMIGGEVVVER